jgi:hypothetical protein
MELIAQKRKKECPMPKKKKDNNNKTVPFEQTLFKAADKAN